MQTEFSNLAELTKAISDEETAITHFTAIRWKNGEFCPYCGEAEIYHSKDNRRHKCRACSRTFSIKVGTVMENTKIPVRDWLITMWLITSHKKGIASAQLARDIGCTQKTAWFMLHRLRHAARTRSFNRPLSGTVEVDESFVGGKDKNQHANKRGLKKKAIVIGMLERGGELRVSKISQIGDVAEKVEDHVQRGSNLMTDEMTAYKRLGRVYRHESVTHSKGEYVRYPEAPKSYNAEWGPMIHVNGIEGYWSQLKRQIYGIHHWVSAKHLENYVAESVWRFNRRDVPEASRLNEMIARLDGRITYKVLIG